MIVPETHMKCAMEQVSPRIILARTLHDSNIGAVSRVMSNMGSKELLLLNPECELTYSAQQAAATGQQALRAARTYKSWDDLLTNETEGLRIGLTARDGRERDVRPLDETLRELQSQFALNPQLPIYFVFGPEHWGLSNDDLDHAHFACSLPTYGENTSYNLSHAVLLALFIFRSTTMLMDKVDDNALPANHKPAALFPDETIKQWLRSLGFDVTRTGTNVYTVLRRLLLHAVPSEKEIRTLEVVLHQSIRKMNEYNWLRSTHGNSPRQPLDGFQDH